MAPATTIDGSPADRAGVRAGEVLLEIDGRAVEAPRLDEAIERMRGFVGSTVKIVVTRAGEPEPLQFELERSDVHVSTVRAEPLPGRYGYVRITHLNDATPRDLHRQLSQVQDAAPLAGLVLDLRGNPGGVLESAVHVADDFLEAGVIVRAEGRTADSRFEMHATSGDLLHHAPLVVLVDHGSASGAEIVAGALRDHGRATLMGERTFGKGSVQTVMPLRNGQALKLTTSRYFTPSGASIHDRGIEPDVSLSAALYRVSAASRDAAADPAVQAVVLATPHSLHADEVVQVARAGKAVFCEKPLSLTRADAQRAMAACKAPIQEVHALSPLHGRPSVSYDDKAAAQGFGSTFSDYYDYSIGLGRSFGRFDFEVKDVGSVTDMSYFDVDGGPRSNDERFILSVATTIPWADEE